MWNTCAHRRLYLTLAYINPHSPLKVEDNILCTQHFEDPAIAIPLFFQMFVSITIPIIMQATLSRSKVQSVFLFQSSYITGYLDGNYYIFSSIVCVLIARDQKCFVLCTVVLL